MVKKYFSTLFFTIRDHLILIAILCVENRQLRIKKMMVRECQGLEIIVIEISPMSSKKGGGQTSLISNFLSSHKLSFLVTTTYNFKKHDLEGWTPGTTRKAGSIHRRCPSWPLGATQPP